ncbi:MAG: hypothetical protein L0387_27635 [Acidobacteria bacterium]|nr:hypothetical protein [Acidobacteriota bacterium]
MRATTHPLFVRLLVSLLLCWTAITGCLFFHGQRYRDFTTQTPLGESDFLVLGFMGGRDAWNKNNALRNLALKLRSQQHARLQVETVENKKRARAVELVRNAFDRDRDGKLDSRERSSARLILYGQSFGGAAVVKLARQLKVMEIPVLLTVQIDSIGKDDAVIPSNVLRAANLFQPNGLLIRGEPKIVPEDPLKTTIIGNFEFDYRQKKVDISAVPWHKKIFRVAHNKIEHDPDVWAKVEELVLEATTTTQF